MLIVAFPWQLSRCHQNWVKAKVPDESTALQQLLDRKKEKVRGLLRGPQVVRRQKRRVSRSGETWD